MIGPAVDAFTRHGAFVVGADTAERADEMVDQLRGGLRFEVE